MPACEGDTNTPRYGYLPPSRPRYRRSSPSQISFHGVRSIFQQIKESMDSQCIHQRIFSLGLRLRLGFIFLLLSLKYPDIICLSVIAPKTLSAPCLALLELQIQSDIKMPGSRTFVSTLPLVATHRRFISCAALRAPIASRLIVQIIQEKCVRNSLGSTKGLHSSEPAEPAAAS
ncbi:hypothetical protein BDN71DRAFT_589968 [Pleurotus eryngii]|uniref:Uncharacterized protein n=1 Tax=Pleurotus eryngii TaxID=5323 RepID=A0A9P6A1W4_PLEER|nr:hypothetical protein BDN71DRAFT_589968 [Pleurotus eryngii]